MLQFTDSNFGIQFTTLHDINNKNCQNNNLKMLKTYNLRTFHNNYRKSNIKWTSFFCTREESSTKPKTKTYSHTVLFPKTNFPARSSINKEKIQKVSIKVII